jgi:hypothetical protein
MKELEHILESSKRRHYLLTGNKHYPPEFIILERSINLFKDLEKRLKTLEKINEEQNDPKSHFSPE